MLGIAVDKKEGALVARPQEFPLPSLGPHDILVKVEAASINRADILLKKGLYPPSNTPILGLDFSGRVVSIGKSVTKYHPGDSVMALTSGGAQAEYAAVHEDLAMMIPKGYSFEEAAAIPEVYLTAFQALHQLGHLSKGQSTLIHSGAGGVGIAAIQLAKVLGAIPYATAGSDEKVTACLSFGAKQAINYHTTPHFSQSIGNIDIILDTVGAPFWKENMQALAKNGKIISIAYLGGSRIPDFDIAEFHEKWATFIGSRLRDRSFEYKSLLVKQFFHFAIHHFENRHLQPIIHAILPWEEVEKAHSLLLENKNIGKVVLRIGQGL